MDQWVVIGVLCVALVLFVWGRWRYDLVALVALLVLAGLDIVPRAEAFEGFGHPAVVTVAAVLVMSRGLFTSGVVDLIATAMDRLGKRPTLQLSGLVSSVAIGSGFMNNVGALALLLPVAIRMSRRSGSLPGTLLMPLAFGSLLGGLLTLIGTPPNIIVATFRASESGEPFRMFDFFPVGAAVAVAGGLFIVLVGWRLIPVRSAGRQGDLFEVKEYTSEVRVPDGSKAAGLTVREVEQLIEGEVTVAALVRGARHIEVPSALEPVRTDDVLVVETSADNLSALVDAGGLEVVRKDEVDLPQGEGEARLTEAIVAADSLAIGRSARSLDLRRNYGVNLLGLARHGTRVEGRLSETPLAVGDIVLLYASEEHLEAALSQLRLLPLAERELGLAYRRRLFPALAIFVGALGVASVGLAPAHVALTAGAVLMVLAGLLRLRDAYEAIEWPVIVLLGAMIPVGAALEATGGSALFASGLLELSGEVPAWGKIALVLVASMLLSNVVNNAAAAILMVGIAAGMARELGVSGDPFMMAAAVGASCAFLTPIGHQSNTLVMGPGGYRFGDYWRMGLPLSVLVAIVAPPVILWVWPMGV